MERVYIREKIGGTVLRETGGAYDRETGKPTWSLFEPVFLPHDNILYQSGKITTDDIKSFYDVIDDPNYIELLESYI